ncbi:MAG: hypothetical protein R2699_10375 [Acidimicrobiales bacterium]
MGALRASGAKLIWGGEAVAVVPEGRANPHQLVMSAASAPAIGELRHPGRRSPPGARHDGRSARRPPAHPPGRWSRPDGRPAPRTAWTHPELDRRVGADAAAVLGDDELDALADRYVDAAVLAADAGFDFVDVKHCHATCSTSCWRRATAPGRTAGRSTIAWRW